jgi:hypothetical protein
MVHLAIYIVSTIIVGLTALAALLLMLAVFGKIFRAGRTHRTPAPRASAPPEPPGSVVNEAHRRLSAQADAEAKAAKQRNDA